MIKKLFSLLCVLAFAFHLADAQPVKLKRIIKYPDSNLSQTWSFNYANNRINTIGIKAGGISNRLEVQYEQDKIVSLSGTSLLDSNHKFELQVFYDSIFQKIDRINLTLPFRVSSIHFQYENIPGEQPRLEKIQKYNCNSEGNKCVEKIEERFEYENGKLKFKKIIDFDSWDSDYDWSLIEVYYYLGNQKIDFVHYGYPGSHGYQRMEFKYNDIDKLRGIFYSGYTGGDYVVGQTRLQLNIDENHQLQDDLTNPSSIFKLLGFFNKDLSNFGNYEIYTSRSSEIERILSDQLVLDVNREQLVNEVERPDLTIQLFRFEYEEKITTTDNYKKNNLNFKVYPNPTTDWCIIPENIEWKSIELLNPSGVQLKNWNNPSTPLNLQYLAAGQYILFGTDIEGQQYNAPIQIIK